MKHPPRTPLITAILVTACALMVCTPAALAQAVKPADEVAPGARTVESRFYELFFTVTDEEIIPIGRHMDAVYAEYADRMKGFAPKRPERSPLYVFATRDEYLAFLRSRGIDGTGSAGLYFWRGDDSGLVVFTEGHTEESLNALLQHEGFHQFARQRLGEHLPTWANEGLAGYFERGRVDDNGRFTTGYASDRDVRVLRELVREDRLLGTEELLTMDPTTWNHRVTTGEAGTQYRQAWAFVQFFVHAERGRYQPFFLDFMRKLAQGQDAVTAFKRAFRVSGFEQVDRAFRRYLDRELRQGLPAG